MTSNEPIPIRRRSLRWIAKQALDFPGSRFVMAFLIAHLPYRCLARIFTVLGVPVHAVVWDIVDWSICTRDFDPVSGVRLESGIPLGRLGSTYGGWVVPQGVLDRNSICYCAGIGEDATFDISLIERYECTVVAIDPTPRAKAYISSYLETYPALKFLDCGLWHKNEAVKFFAPADPAHVSHSALNLHKTDDYFVADCRTISSLMREFRHDRINLLKLDVEGAEYAVLDTVLEQDTAIDIICVEYDEASHPLDHVFLSRIRDSLRALLRAGYEIVAIEPRCNYTLLHRSCRRSNLP